MCTTQLQFTPLDGGEVGFESKKVASEDNTEFILKYFKEVRVYACARVCVYGYIYVELIIRDIGGAPPCSRQVMQAWFVRAFCGRARSSDLFKFLWPVSYTHLRAHET